jgi:hypothetical protein
MDMEGYGNSVISAQFFCEPKRTLSEKVHFKMGMGWESRKSKSDE